MLLPRRLRQLFERKEKEQNTFALRVDAQALEILPDDHSIRPLWFSLTIREREVTALVCMGYRNYEIASLLGIGYPTVLTHLQNIYHKFELHDRKSLRAVLKSWPAEEWWKHHH